jgi:hypothetical protein
LDVIHPSPRAKENFEDAKDELQILIFRKNEKKEHRLEERAKNLVTSDAFRIQLVPEKRDVQEFKHSRGHKFLGVPTRRTQ